jgi:hypothetical protein
MATLQSTNVIGSLCVNGVAIGGGGKDFKICCFTASDSWTPPSDLVTADGLVEAIVIGGGGGGGAGMTRNMCGGSCGRCVIAGQGAGGGLDGGLKIMTSSNDACTITIGTGGNSGSFTCDFSTFTICSAATPATAGGNSCALGYIGYGGGAGALAGCSDGRYSICCDVNSYGGPAGGTIKVTNYHSVANTHNVLCIDHGNVTNGGMCSTSKDKIDTLVTARGGSYSTCAFGVTTDTDRSQCVIMSFGGQENSVWTNVSPARICNACNCKLVSGSLPLEGDNYFYNDMCHGTIPSQPFWPNGHYAYTDGNGQYMGMGGAFYPGTYICGLGSAYTPGGFSPLRVTPLGYGNGGYGPEHGTKSTNCFISDPGSVGTDGIVILKWNE